MSLSRVQEITDELSAKIDCPVAVNDYALDLISASAQVGPIDRYRVDSIMKRHTPPEVIAYLRENSLLHRKDPFMVEEGALPGMQARMCIPLVDDGFPIAFIWVVFGDKALNDSMVTAIRAAASSVLDALLNMRGGEADELLRDSQRLQAALSPDQFSADYALSALVSDGVPREPGDDAVVVFDFEFEHSIGDTQATFRPIHQHARNTWARGALLGISEGNLAMICSSSELEWRMKQARSHLSVNHPTTPILKAVGFSTCEHSAAGVLRAFEEAQFTARVARTVQSVGPVAKYDQLGAFIALRHLPTTEASVTLLSPEAAKLRSRDSRVNAETLLVYLNSGCSVADTCSELSIHRTTLYYRLDRIREIVGDAIEVGWRRTSVHLGLLMGELVDAA